MRNTTGGRKEKQLVVDLLIPPGAEYGYAGIVVIGWEGEEPTPFDLEPQPSDWGLSYRLTKHAGARRGDGDDAYDVLFEEDGTASCDCRGNQRWGHCKHVRALLQLREEGRLALPLLPSHEWDEMPAGQSCPDDPTWDYKPQETPF